MQPWYSVEDFSRLTPGSLYHFIESCVARRVIHDGVETIVYATYSQTFDYDTIWFRLHASVCYLSVLHVSLPEEIALAIVSMQVALTKHRHQLCIASACFCRYTITTFYSAETGL